MMRARRATSCFLLFSVLSLRTVTAQADAKGEAQALFDEGLRLFDARDYRAACEKFTASHRAEPAAATLLNLGRCYDAAGKQASARRAYADAVAQARAEHDEPRAKIAKQKESDVGVLVPRVTIEAAAPDVHVECDGEAVVLGAATEVDPGTHTITATAPGKRSFTTSLTINAAETKMVAIPPLESSSAPEARSGGSPLGKNPRQTIALAVGGAGVLAAGIGTYFGLRATSLQSDAESHCTPQHVCTARGVDLTERAGTAADISTVAFLLGGALIAGGIVLWVTAPDTTGGPAAKTPPPRARMTFATSGTGIWLGGTY